MGEKPSSSNAGGEDSLPKCMINRWCDLLELWCNQHRRARKGRLSVLHQYGVRWGMQMCPVGMKREAIPPEATAQGLRMCFSLASGLKSSDGVLAGPSGNDGHLSSDYSKGLSQRHRARRPPRLLRIPQCLSHKANGSHGSRVRPSLSVKRTSPRRPESYSSPAIRLIPSGHTTVKRFGQSRAESL